MLQPLMFSNRLALARLAVPWVHVKLNSAKPSAMLLLSIGVLRAAIGGIVVVVEVVVEVVVMIEVVVEVVVLVVVEVVIFQ
jgi:hypothetical protein